MKGGIIVWNFVSTHVTLDNDWVWNQDLKLKYGPNVVGNVHSQGIVHNVSPPCSDPGFHDQEQVRVAPPMDFIVEVLSGHCDLLVGIGVSVGSVQKVRLLTNGNGHK